MPPGLCPPGQARLQGGGGPCNAVLRHCISRPKRDMEASGRREGGETQGDRKREKPTALPPGEGMRRRGGEGGVKEMREKGTEEGGGERRRRGGRRGKRGGRGGRGEGGGGRRKEKEEGRKEEGRIR